MMYLAPAALVFALVIGFLAGPLIYRRSRRWCTDCGATDWADLRQRMHFILNLFRAFHATETMFDAPFRPEQVRMIREGRLPHGEL